MLRNVAKKLGCLVVGYLAVYSLVHYYLFDSWPDVDTEWASHAWQLMGPSGSDE
ncbi:hypothetical protein SAMN04487948_101167 [Halogranum amylolyticum]|uniref:Uncharacterized protein n=1 Tax=Halogranum amylolyticum TaxID=660520 RepID=A0A1H8MXU3_9EURY|nr:hypothetical protein [Halogranum amylolyticum]SEO22100.1 hypothetical protein SAMN04487948_101167 [Halogranum amylolyticum]